jgi:lysophospholipase L1-like esterase
MSPEPDGAPEPSGTGALLVVLEELRLGWFVVGLLLLVVLTPWVSIRWGLVTGLPWLVGAAVLWDRRRGVAAAAALAQIASTRAARRALVVLGAIDVLAAYVFGPGAALLLLVCAAAVVVPLAAARKTVLLEQLLVNGAVACVATAVALGGAEAAFRTEWLGWKLGSRQEKAAWGQRYDGLWKHNVFGFRSPYETVKRRPGVKRIYATGDSYTWGAKIAETDSIWPARLEQALRETYPGIGFEVINAGRDGWTTANEAELLRRLGWQFHPDLIVVQYTINDALPSGPNFRHSGDQLLYPRLQLLPPRFRVGVVRSSAVLSVLEDKLSFLTPSRGFSETYEDEWAGWQEMQSALREIGDSSRARGTPVVLMIFPSLVPGEHTADSYPYAPIIEKVSAAATAAGLDVLDLVPVLAAQGGDWRRWWATPYDGHPNSAAHALAAQALAEYIARNGWLAGSPQR